jgi:hypothetical protein
LSPAPTPAHFQPQPGPGQPSFWERLAAPAGRWIIIHSAVNLADAKPENVKARLETSTSAAPASGRKTWPLGQKV